ncbi:hypothetical protein GCM10028807_36510 [Spirosoma daeguense]
MIGTYNNDILFDDRSLLEATFGENALKVSSINANCDCDGYYANQNDEDLNPHPIPASATSAN